MKWLLCHIVIALLLTISLELNEEFKEEEYFNMPELSSEWHIKVQVNTPFSIRIQANPTTGYIWYIGNAKEIDNGVLSMKNLTKDGSSNDFRVDQQYDGIVGQPGYYSFAFEGKKPTLPNTPIKIDFINKRPWETTSIDIVTTYLTITE